MAVLQGNVSGSINTVSFNIPATVISLILVTRASSDVIVNVYVVTEDGDRSVVPLNLTLISGTMYYSDTPIIMKPGYYFIIVTNGSLDYYISLE